MRARCRFLLLVATLLLPGLCAAGDDVVMEAMRAELTRSMEQLRLGDLDRPYYIAYWIDDIEYGDVTATFGSLVHSGSERLRILRAEVRVGDYELDDTNFFTASGGGDGFNAWHGAVQLPLDDDPMELRRHIWLATDAAYKQAAENLAKKRAVLQNRTRTEVLPDFTAAEPRSFTQLATVVPFDRERAEVLVRDASAVFRELPAVFESTVQLSTEVVTTRWVSSEGGSFVRVTPRVGLAVAASTQAEDGMALFDGLSAYGTGLDDLPARQELHDEIMAIGRRLARLRVAPLPETYNGPVLVEAGAAAQLFSQGFVGKLLGTRRPVSDNPSFDIYAEREENPFLDKLRARVLARVLGLVDDPTATEFEGAPLLGGYVVDEEGVPAAPTTLVHNGLLKGLLTTRTPVRGLEGSTGNRRGGTVMPSNLLFSVTEGKSREELRAELLAIVAERELEYGYVIRRIADPALARLSTSPAAERMLAGTFTQAISPVVEAYRVRPDGSEELVRNISLADVGAATFKDIIAASDELELVTLPFERRISYGFGSSAMTPGRTHLAVLVSMVAPTVLFEDLTLKRPTGEIPKLPVAANPNFVAEAAAR